MRMVLAAICLSMVTGCASTAVVGKAWPGDIKPGSLNGIINVHWAANDGKDNIVICARGKVAGAEKPETADFAISVSAGAFGVWTKEEKRWCKGEPLVPNSIPMKILQAESAVAGCPAPESLPAKLPIQMIDPGISNADCSSASLLQLHDLVVSDSQLEAVYVGPSYGWESRTFIERNSGTAGGSQVIEIKVDPARTEGNKGWLLALPLTVPFDIVTMPFITLYWSIVLGISGDSF